MYEKWTELVKKSHAYARLKTYGKLLSDFCWLWPYTPHDVQRGGSWRFLTKSLIPQWKYENEREIATYKIKGKERENAKTRVDDRVYCVCVYECIHLWTNVNLSSYPASMYLSICLSVFYCLSVCHLYMVTNCFMLAESSFSFSFFFIILCFHFSSVSFFLPFFSFAFFRVFFLQIGFSHNSRL